MRSEEFNKKYNFKLMKLDCCVSCLYYDTEPRECNFTNEKVPSNGLCNLYKRFEGEL